jgi:hypothetical protein
MFLDLLMSFQVQQAMALPAFPPSQHQITTDSLVAFIYCVTQSGRQLLTQMRLMLWQVLALTSLVQCQLEAASIYTTWMEGTSYSKFTKV